jgi:hypothetical protein
MSTKALAISRDHTRKGKSPEVMPEDCPVLRALLVYQAVQDAMNAAAKKKGARWCYDIAFGAAYETLCVAIADETRPVSKAAAYEAAEMHRVYPDGVEDEDLLSAIMARHLREARAAKKLNN